MKIAVTGSLGNIGKHLIPKLVQNGHQVTGIHYKSEGKAEIEAAGAIPAIGSVEDADFLADVFKDTDAVFLMVPPNYIVPNSRAYYNTIGKNYAQAIRQSRLQRIVNVSSWGAHLTKGTGFILGAHDVEQILNQLTGVNTTHLRAGYLYYNLYRFIDMIKKTGKIISNYGGHHKIVLTAPKDIADAAVTEFEKGLGEIALISYVASDDRSSLEIASVLGDAIGKPDLSWEIITDNQLRKLLEQQHLPKDIIQNTITLNTSIRNGKMREDYEARQVKPRGLIKLKDFALEFATMYNQI